MKDGQNRIRIGTEQEHAEISRLKRLAGVMDAAFVLPGTTIRIGWDPVVGLIPGIGDAASAFVSGFIIYRAARLGASGPLVVRMIGNVLIDAVLGAVPVLGDFFDVGWKANIRNVELLERAVSDRKLWGRTHDEAGGLFRRLLLLGAMLLATTCAILGLMACVAIVKALL